MMKLKLFSRNSAKPALLFLSLAFFLITLSGCKSQFEPTYKEKDIPFIVKKICKEDYGLNVTTVRTHNTLWIYTPLERLMDKEYGIKEGKVFDEEIMSKLGNILTAIGRVLLNAEEVPEFYALLASDIKLGIDYTLIGNVVDIRKSSAGFIPGIEAYRRYVMRLKSEPRAIGDISGKHIEATEINLPDFLAEQIVQRIGARFQDGELKKYFKMEKVDGRYSDKMFYFEYSIKETALPQKKIDINKEMLSIIAYCIQSYDFKDFSAVKISDLDSQKTLELNPGAIQEYFY